MTRIIAIVGVALCLTAIFADSMLYKEKPKRPPAYEFRDSAAAVIFSIAEDGKMEFAKGTNPNKAALEFAKHLHKHWPRVFQCVEKPDEDKE